MLLLLLSFYLHYGLLNCEVIVKAKFNESSLVDQHRRILRQMNSLLEDLAEKTKKISGFKPDDHEYDIRRQTIIYETTSSALTSEIPEQDQNDQNLKTTIEPGTLPSSPDVPIVHDEAPPPEIPPSPQDVPVVPGEGLQSEISPSPQDDPLVPEEGTLPEIPPSTPDVPFVPGEGLPSEISPSPPDVPLVPDQDLPPSSPGSDAPPSDIPPDPTELVKDPVETTKPVYPLHQLIPMNSIYPSLRMPPSLFSENSFSHYVANNLYPPNIVGNGKQVLYKKPPFKGQYPMIPLRGIYAPPSSANFYVSEYTPRHDSKLTKTIRTTTIGANAKIWLNEIAPYTRAKKKVKKASQNQSRPSHMGTTVPKNDWSFIGKYNTAQMFNKENYGFLHVAWNVRPRTTQEDPHKTSMATTAGDVLYGKIKVQKSSTTQAPEQRHLALMKQLEEGYLMVFIIEMFRLIAVKDKREVQEVLAPMKAIYNSLSVKGHLAWVGDPLSIFIEKLSNVASSGEDSINVIRTYSSMMFHSLLKRKEQLSDEVNSIIDHAEMFYSDEEGKRLLRSVSQFEDYPKNSKASYWVCTSLIENILQPFRRPAISRSRERLLDSVNRALRRRFPLLIRERIRPKVGTYQNKRQRKPNPQKKRRVFHKQ